ncbi:MAG: hypothetical protein SGJ24_10840 [Chloroflexota bacterium]|nr:hypothetical protein [Chloroflexota bacterium]
MNEITRLAWARFGIITGILGDLQGRVIVTLFYFTVLVPFGIGSRLLSDPMRIRREENRRPVWLDRPAVGISLEEAREQG